LKRIIVCLAGLAMCAGAIAMEKSKLKNAERSKPATPTYARVPFNVDLGALPPKYRGHSIEELLARIKVPQPKGEFEKTEDYEGRLASGKTIPITGTLQLNDSLAFRFDQRIDGTGDDSAFRTQYDADKEELTAIFEASYNDISPSDGSSRTWLVNRDISRFVGSYTGTNAYGVQFDVNQLLSKQTGLAISRSNMVFDWPRRQFSFKVKLDPKQAQQTRISIAAILVAELESPYVAREKRYKRAKYDSSIGGATNDVTTEMAGLVVSVKQIWLVNSNTGELLVKLDAPFKTKM
jgi:hypothetical protein